MTAQSTQTSQKGFTLIALLVTIAIIAIISVVAVALFGNIQANARDAKRMAELEAIANVLEVNKTGTGYSAINCSNFGGGLCPGRLLTTDTTAQDPSSYPYCINTTAAIGNPATTGWTNTGTVACPASWTIIGNGVPSGNPAQYKI